MDIMNFSKQQLSYCSDYCDIGCRQKEKLLKECESAFDAASDMWYFVEHCSETCDIIKMVGESNDAKY